MITEQDYYNIIDTAREDGIAIGKTEGLIEGETKGLARGRVEVARSLKGLGVPFETIVKATGLSESEIAAL